MSAIIRSCVANGTSARARKQYVVVFGPNRVGIYLLEQPGKVAQLRFDAFAYPEMGNVNIVSRGFTHREHRDQLLTKIIFPQTRHIWF